MGQDQQLKKHCDVFGIAYHKPSQKTAADNSIIDQTAYSIADHSITAYILSPDKPSTIAIACLIHHQYQKQFFISFFVKDKAVSPFCLPAFIGIEQADFLWQDTCFECFFEQGHSKNKPNDSQNNRHHTHLSSNQNRPTSLNQDEHNQNSYIEVNASPKGAYACYTFCDYRTPNTIPPVKARHTQIRFAWANTAWQSLSSRHFVVSLAQKATHINPTAIIINDGVPIFYAPKHKNPPDFHDKAFWLPINHHQNSP